MKLIGKGSGIEWFPPLSQLSDQLDSAREQSHQLEGQLQKKEVALTALNGKIELLTAEAQAKVSSIYKMNSPPLVSDVSGILLMVCISSSFLSDVCRTQR